MAKIPDSVQYFESQLKKIRPPKKPAAFMGVNYVGGGQSKWVYLDHSLPQIRALYKAKGPHSAMEFEQQLNFFEELWFRSQIFEAKAIALIWLEHQSTEELVEWVLRLSHWANEVDNWAHSDSLSGCYARIFEHSPGSLLNVFKNWNRHKNPWLRRISMVSLMYYSRQRKKLPRWNLIKSFVSPHLKAKEHYVQKAVGWTLRESYNVYPQQTVQYVDSNIDKISSVAWVATSEKMPPKLKNKLLKKRKSLRKALVK